MKAKKLLATIVSFLLVFVVLFSALFIAAEADHECSGEDCPICQVILIAEKTLKGLSLLVLVVQAVVAAKTAVCKARDSLADNTFHFTPVLFKVKLTN